MVFVIKKSVLRKYEHHNIISVRIRSTQIPQCSAKQRWRVCLCAPYDWKSFRLRFIDKLTNVMETGTLTKITILSPKSISRAKRLLHYYTKLYYKKIYVYDFRGLFGSCNGHKSLSSGESRFSRTGRGLCNFFVFCNPRKKVEKKIQNHSHIISNYRAVLGKKIGIE